VFCRGNGEVRKKLAAAIVAVAANWIFAQVADDDYLVD
jgi:hypothetical protein